MVWSWGLCVRSAGCCSSNKICNKNHLLHLVGILFPHINDDAPSKSHRIYMKKYSCGKSHWMKIITASIFLISLLIVLCLLQGSGATNLSSQYTTRKHSDRHSTGISSPMPAKYSQQLNATSMT
jgi:hypothetical protein